MRYSNLALMTMVMALVSIQAQPPPRPASDDALCEEEPREAVEPDLSKPEADGFHSLFNGVDFTGWWLNCRTIHGGGTSRPRMRIDSGLKALYTIRNGNYGGVLMTKAKFTDYEIVFDYWPAWVGDAALLHRTDSSGRAYATTLGYLPFSSLGGVWGEGGIFSRDLRPFAFEAVASDISIPGKSGGVNWTHITRELKAAREAVPCPDSGCTQEDWRRLWDFNNWNQIRVIFHGGRNADDPVHMRSWFRKLGAEHWVPLLVDTTLIREIKPGYIGLRIGGGGVFLPSHGTWYRNIRWRPWTSSPSAADRGLPAPAGHRPRFKVDPDRQTIRIIFAKREATRNLRVLSLDGKTMAELVCNREEALLSTTGWKRGIYLVDVGAGGHRNWARLILP